MVKKRLVINNTKDCLYPYILRILKDKQTHAYVLKKEVEKRFGFKPGTVTPYKVLYQLKFEGLVETKKIGRTLVYHLTKKGFTELADVIKFYKKQVELLE